MEFAQFCAENSIQTEESIYESEDSSSINLTLSGSFANMTSYGGYHAEEARQLYSRNNTPVSAGGAAHVTGGHTNVGPRQPETPPPANAHAANRGATHVTPARQLDELLPPRRIGTPGGAAAFDTPEYIELMRAAPRTVNRPYYQDPTPMHTFSAQ